MKTSMKIMLLAILLINSINCNAQQDSLKQKVINYLIEKGDLDKTNDIRDYFDNIFIVNLIKNKNSEFNNTNYLYKIGTHTSHSFVYLMLKNGNKYEFIDVKKIDEVIIHVIKFLKEKKRPSKEILENVEMIIALYQRNLKTVPWTN
jgi:hypothetical protein